MCLKQTTEKQEQKQRDKFRRKATIQARDDSSLVQSSGSGGSKKGSDSGHTVKSLK